MSEEKEFAALLVDYEEARDDERHFVALQGTALTLALTALSLLGALAVIQWRDQDSSAIPDVVIAGAPLIVLVILAYVQSAGAQAVMRSFYMRALEREIRSRLPQPIRLDNYPELRVMSSAELQATYAAMGTSATTRGSFYYRFMASWIFTAAWIGLGGMVIALSLGVSLAWRMTMIPFYLLAALVIFGDTLRVNRHGREFFENQVSVAAERLRHDLRPWRKKPRARGSRSLGSYLLLPRPDDLVKVLFVLTGMLFGWLSTWGAQTTIATAGELVLFVVALEYLVYQSRYQWNDIRGVHEDSQAPDSLVRGRLPGGERNVGPSMAVMLARIYMIMVIVAMGDERGDTFSSLDRLLIISLLLVYLVALPYELVRSRARMSQECSAGQLRLTLFLVGLGYPLRFGLGWLAFGGDLSVWFFVALAGIWGLGLSFVSLTWVLEAGGYVTRSVVNAAGVRVFGGSPEAPIAAKPHLLALFREVGFIWTDRRPGALNPESVLDGNGVKWLQQLPREAANFRSPWIFGAAVYFISLGLSGGSLVGLPDMKPVIACILAVVILAFSCRYLGHVWAHILASLTMMAGFWVAGSSVTTSPPQARVTSALLLLTALPTIIYALFQAQSYSSTRQGVQQVLLALYSLLLAAYRWFVGSTSTAGTAHNAASQSRSREATASDLADRIDQGA